MNSKKGEKASFVINTDTTWSISGEEEWLFVSAKSGVGTTQVNLETLRANESAESRPVTLTIKAGNSTQSITITQEPGAKPLYISIKDETIMSDGYYADLNFTRIFHILLFCFNIIYPEPLSRSNPGITLSTHFAFYALAREWTILRYSTYTSH